MEPEADHCRAFLLRVWTREQDHALLSSVQDVETGETHVFSDLEHLSAWLRGEIRCPRGGDGTIRRRGTPNTAAPGT